MRRISGIFNIPLCILLGTVFLLSSCSSGGGGGSTLALPLPNTSTTPSGTTTTPVPAPPMSVSAVAGDGTITLGWSVVTYASSYNVYRSDTSGGSRTKIASPSVTPYADTKVTNGNQYYYVVTAVNSSGESAVSSEVSATPTSTAPVTVTISGTIQYQDKEYDTNGFTGNQPYKAVRFSSIELVDALSGTAVATGQTGSDGSYSITTTPASNNFYVRINAVATPPLSASSVTVYDLSLIPNIYAFRSDDFVPFGSANVNVSIQTSSIGGVFNILDVFTNGFQFVYAQSAGTYPPALAAYWSPGNPYGTFYCPAGYCSASDGIYVLNDLSAGDTDEYDDDVLYHEFGHFTAAHFSQDDSPGGAHMLTSNDLDMRLAWSEGWGDSMPGNIKLWLNSLGQAGQDLLSSATGVSLTEYVDTISSGAGIAIDMDRPDWTYDIPPVYFSYATSEMAIAKILLDLNINFGMQDVWAVLTNFQTNHPSPVNLELFWDQWHSLGKPLTPGVLSQTIDSIFQGRSVKYAPDVFEPDNTFGSASTYTVNMAVPQVHTLYTGVGGADLDFVSFSTIKGQQYTITTSALLNGADTLISLYDNTQALINTNDNSNGYTYSGYVVPYLLQTVPSDNFPSLCDSYGICHENGSDKLGSKLSFTASSSGTYYVMIQSSPTRPVSAGRYGTYTLTITSP